MTYLCSVVHLHSQRFIFSITPGEDWGPALNKFRAEAGYPLLPETGSDGKTDDPPGYDDIFKNGKGHPTNGTTQSSNM